MFHEPIKTRMSQPLANKHGRTRRKVIGFREIFIVLLAFALLAIVPSFAQILPAKPRPIEDVSSRWDAEDPAANFPGSAFFYLEASDARSNATRGQKPEDSTAQPFVIAAGSMEHARALKCLTDAIYYEAANEPDDGQRAIAQVILNRLRHPAFPNSVCGVIYQGSERATGCQFSYSCDGSMARIPARASWLRAQHAADDALAGYVFTPVGMATHYHATYVYPAWASSLDAIGTIGAHRFYKWRGRAGQPSAFVGSYARREPYPGPSPRIWSTATVPELDPVLLQKKFEAEFAARQLSAQTKPAGSTRAVPFFKPDAVYDDGRPQYTAPAANLPQGADIKPQYQNSGTWKNLPTG